MEALSFILRKIPNLKPDVYELYRRKLAKVELISYGDAEWQAIRVYLDLTIDYKIQFCRAMKTALSQFGPAKVRQQLRTVFTDTGITRK